MLPSLAFARNGPEMCRASASLGRPHPSTESEVFVAILGDRIELHYLFQVEMCGALCGRVPLTALFGVSVYTEALAPVLARAWCSAMPHVCSLVVTPQGEMLIEQSCELGARRRQTVLGCSHWALTGHRPPAHSLRFGEPSGFAWTELVPSTDA